jgi:hypothetical protein
MGNSKTNGSDFSGRLAAGAARAEITPPLEVGLLISSVNGQWAPFESVRQPLFARAVMLEGFAAHAPFDRTQRVALVSLDLLALSGKALGGFREFKARICKAAEHVVEPSELVLVCTHTHSAPESAAITDLYRTPAFAQWVEDLAERIGGVIVAAASELVPCELVYGRATAPGLGIHRRFKTTRGVMMSHPEPAADTILSRDGPVDDSVNVMAFRDAADRAVATLVNATCHPVYEMCQPQVSPDYPGELCALLDERNAGVSLFLNGAAGNINPVGVSSGPVAARHHAHQLADAVERALHASKRSRDAELVLRRRVVQLPSRLPEGQVVGETIAAGLIGMRLGDAALVFLPGEPFVETGLALRRASPREFTAVVGFAEETVGYIPTDSAFQEGGYETRFGPWSILAPTSEDLVRREGIGLLDELGGEEPSRESLASRRFDHSSNAEQTTGEPSIAQLTNPRSPGRNR